MATVGSKNQPLVAAGDVFNPVTDINNSTNWSAGFAMALSVANATARNALTGANVWAGLIVYQQDTGEYYTYSGSGWYMARMGTPPRIELTRTATQTSTSANQTTQTGWTVTASRGGLTHSTGVVTIPRTGNYNVYALCHWAANTTGVRMLTLLSGSTALLRTSTMTISTASVETSLELVGTSVALSSGNTISIQARQDSGGTLNTTGATVPMKFIVEWAGE
jgi:hypothetical protein